MTKIAFGIDSEAIREKHLNRCTRVLFGQERNNKETNYVYA